MTPVLVIASTFPASDSDSVPAFVKDQINAMKMTDESLHFSVLAPHDSRSNTKNFTKHNAYDEYRFHYAWPRATEKLAGKGIMPTLYANPLYLFLIPSLFICEGISTYKIVRKIKPELIYAHWFTPQAVIARVVGSLTKTPFVFTTHASDVAVWHKIPLIGTPVVRWCTREAKAFTAVSQRSMDKLASFFTKDEWTELKKRSKIIPMGVTIPTEQAYTLTHSNNILFIGRLAEKKGVQYLLPAFKQLVKEKPNTTLTIAGDGPWLSRLRQQAHELNLTSEQIVFAGYATGDAKQQLISSHTVYVIPSIIADNGDAEGLPVTLMEGLAAGKICIATNESGADNILTNGKDGLLVPQRNSKELTNALKKALSLSDTNKKQMSSDAQRTAKQFSWPIVAREHIDFLIKGKM